MRQEFDAIGDHIPIGSMNYSLTLNNPLWRTVYIIPKGTTMLKGRHGLYHELLDATKSFKERFGCYSWQSVGTIYYCGSYAKDYKRGHFKTNLQGRIHNYFQNHRIDSKTGRKNTNLMVFENLNKMLRNSDVSLCVLVFGSLRIGADEIDFDTFVQDPGLVHAVEELLICSYRRQKQCDWNRT